MGKGLEAADALLSGMTTLPGLQTQDNVLLSWAHLYGHFYNTFNRWLRGATPLLVRMDFPGGCLLAHRGL